MHGLKKYIVYFSTSLTLLVVVFLWMTLSFNPTTKVTPELNHQDVIKLKKALSQSNPFKYQRNGLKNITISEKNANQGVRIFIQNYLPIFSPSYIRDTPINIQFHNNYATISASPKISIFANNFFVNIKFSISFNLKAANNEKTIISETSIGRISVPDKLAKRIFSTFEDILLTEKPDYRKLLSSIKRVRISDKVISVNYRWDRHFANHARKMSKDILFSVDEQKRIAIYYEQLSTIPRFYLRRPISIHKIIRTLFKFTQKRVNNGNDSIAENKATLLTLGIFASGIRINRLIQGENRKYLRHLYYGKLTLSGRSDLMRHFLISAALTVSSNKILADTIGLSKEVSDANGVSGFSFVDLLADHSGVALAKFATSPSTATQFIERIIDSKLKASDFMPSHTKLPEKISTLSFQRDYGGVNGEIYLGFERDISQRINSLPIYNQPSH